MAEKREVHVPVVASSTLKSMYIISILTTVSLSCVGVIILEVHVHVESTSTLKLTFIISILMI